MGLVGIPASCSGIRLARNGEIFAVASVQTLALDGLLLSRDCLQALAVKLEQMSGVLFWLGRRSSALEPDA